MNHNDQQFMAQRIRAQYMEKEGTEPDALRELDKEVKRPATVLAYALGSISGVVMGAGMSLVMTELGAAIGLSAAMPIGVVVGVVGLAAAALNYPLYKHFLAARKAKYADRILALSDKILGEQNSDKQ